MDEEDGRPGARAVKSGPLDAHRDVLTLPLQFNDDHSERWVPQVSLLRPGTNLRAFTDLLQNEEKNENVPGK